MLVLMLTVIVTSHRFLHASMTLTVIEWNALLHNRQVIATARVTWRLSGRVAILLQSALIPVSEISTDNS